MAMHKLRFGMVTTFPPGTGSLNEYAYHFVNALQQKQEVEDIFLFVDELPAGKTYTTTLHSPSGLSSVETDATRTKSDSTRATIQPIPCWRFNGLFNFVRLFKTIKQRNVDVVLFNIQFASFGDRKVPATLGLLTPVLLRMAGIPTVVLLHNIMETVDLQSAGFAGNVWLERLIRFFGKVVTHLLLRANLVAVTIPKYVEILEKQYGANNVLLAPHGAFESAAQEPTYALPDGPLQIMTFGKFGTYKRVEALLEAFALLQEQLSVSLELVIAGTDSPNAPEYLETMANHYAHIPNVRFTGYVAEEDVPQIFGEAAVVVFPYTSTTGSSGVLHQAGDYGKAVVLPQIGDLAELVAEEGYIGEFFQPADAQSLAEAIRRILDDSEYRMAMGRQNYLAARGLPLADVLDWYLLHIETVLNGKSAIKWILSTQKSS